MISKQIRALLKQLTVWTMIYLIGGYPSVLFALPQDGQIVSGQGSIQQPTAQDMVIDQNTGKLSINWRGFSIGGSESVRFNQPGRSSIALNRVYGVDPSIIAGKLSANGQVFISNPSGVFFMQGSRVDVHGLLATTLKISDEDFLNEQYKFSQDPALALSSVINQGNINATGYVGLLAPSVANEGTIVANLGSVALGAGTAATVDFTGDGLINFAITDAVSGEILDAEGNPLLDRVSNSGLIRADGGQVIMTAKDAGDVIRNVVNQTGVIEARTVVEKEGRIFLAGADNGTVNISGNLDASGDDAGEQGGSIDIQGASVTQESGSIDATGNGAQGGSINIEGSQWVGLGGTVDASGKSGGTVDIEAGGFSLASEVLAKGTTGQGGTVNIHSKSNSWETGGSKYDVSGAEGGSITHIADKQIVSSGVYLALGHSGKGGKIDVTAPTLKFLTATFDASGETGGGTIRLGGEFQGGKNLEIDEIPNAGYIFLTDSTTVKADTLGEHGDGGTIIAWSDVGGLVLGKFFARPGSETGLGGFVEVSSGDTISFGGEATTGIGDRLGEFLLDPHNVIVDDPDAIQLDAIIGAGYQGSDPQDPNIDQDLDPDDLFGAAVSLDGNRLAVGAQHDDGFTDAGNDEGAVYLYTFTDSNFYGGILEAIIGKDYTGGKNIDQPLGSGDHFGVDVSLDGNRLAVGAPFEDGADNSTGNSGAVYLYSFTDSAFSAGSLVARIGDNYDGVGDGSGLYADGTSAGAKDLDLTLASGDLFGDSVSLDGNRLAVGARGDDGSGVNNSDDKGAVYLFTFSDSAFSSATLKATIGDNYSGLNDIDQPVENSDRFGDSVSLSGNNLAVGASGDDGADNASTGSGVVYLYSFPDSAFTTGTLEARIGDGYDGVGVTGFYADGTLADAKDFDLTLANSDFFGAAVSLDGTKLAVGATGDDGAASDKVDSGAVFLFSFSGTNGSFDGATLHSTIGDGYEGGGNVNQPLDAGDLFGASVSLDGNRLAVGAASDDGAANASDEGAVYLYTFTNSSFDGFRFEAIIGDGYGNDSNFDQSLDSNDEFGTAVALDGLQLAVGAPSDAGASNLGGVNTGAVYLYTFTDLNFNGAVLQGVIGDGYTGSKNIDQNLDVGDFFGMSVSLDDNRLAVGATSDDGADNSGTFLGAVYLYSFTDDYFSGGALQARIGKNYDGVGDGSGLYADGTSAVAKDFDLALTNSDQFGYGVSLDGNRLAVGAPHDDGAGSSQGSSGVVYLFSFADSAFSTPALQSQIGLNYSGGTGTYADGTPQGNDDLSQPVQSSDTFGSSVSLYGNSLAVGAPGDDGALNGTSGSGVVYLYTFADSAFTSPSLQARIGDAYDGTGASGLYADGTFVSAKDFDLTLTSEDAFGTSVSLGEKKLAVGAPGDDGPGDVITDLGAVYLFTFGNSSFSSLTNDGIIGNTYVNGNNINQSLDTDEFGTSVSLDGNRLAVGAVLDSGLDNGSLHAGAVWLYSFAGTGFTDGRFEGVIGDGYDNGNDISQGLDDGDLFGHSVSMDGNQLAVGATSDDGALNASNEGAVYLYTFTDSDFSGGMLAGIIGKGYTGGNNIDQSIGSGDNFGASVSLRSTQLAVGATNDDGADNEDNNTGVVYLYAFSDTDFSGGTLVSRIGANYDGSGYTGAGAKDFDLALTNQDRFGSSVSLEDQRLAVGASGDDGAANSGSANGVVYLFSFADGAFSSPELEAQIGLGYSGGTGTYTDGTPQSAKDIALPLDNSDSFGAAVSLDGNGLAVGAPLDGGADNLTAQAGAVYLFTFSDSSFSSGALQARLGVDYSGGTGTYPDGTPQRLKDRDLSLLVGSGDRFGSSLSLAVDDLQLAVGAPFDDGFGGSASQFGAVYLFSATDTTFTGGALDGIVGSGYTGTGSFNQSLDNGDFFGTSLSLSDGRLAVGAEQDEGPGNFTTDSGAVYLYTLPEGEDPITDAVFATRASEDITIFTDTLAGLLGSPQNVTLQANNDLKILAELTVNNAGGDGGNLTLQAGRSVFLYADITTDNGDLMVIANELLANGVVDAQRDAGTAFISMATGVEPEDPGSTVDAGTGTVTFELRDGAGKTNTTAGDIFLGSIIADTISITSVGDIEQLDDGLLTANTLTLTTTGLNKRIGTQGELFTPIEIAVATSLTANATNGNGRISLSNTGALPIHTVNAGTGDVRIISTGAITDISNTVTGDEIRIDVTGSGGIGTSGTPLKLAATGEVTLLSGSGGDIFVSHTGNLTLGEVIGDEDGEVVITTTGTLTTASEDIFGGMVTLQLAADKLLTVDGDASVIGDSLVHLIADLMTLDGSITAGGGETLIIQAAENGTKLRLGSDAGADVNGAGNAGTLALDDDDLGALDGDAFQFGSATINGETTIANDGVTLNFSAPTTIFSDDLKFEAAGDALNVTTSLTLDAEGTITDAPGNDTTTDITTGTLTIADSTGIGSSAANALNLSVDNLTVTNTSGNAFITNNKTLNVGTLNFGANNANIRATSGNIVDDTSAITAADLTLTVDGSGSTIGASGTSLNTALSGTLNAFASTGAGGIFISNTGALDIGDVDAGTGNVEIASTGSITDSATTVTGNNVTIQVTGLNAAIGTSSALVATAVSGTLTLLAQNGNGGIFVSQTGNLILGQVDATTGDVEIETTGTLGTTSGMDIQGNDITLMLALDNLLTVNANTSILGANNVSLIADEMTLLSSGGDTIKATAGTLLVAAAEDGTKMRIGDNAGADVSGAGSAGTLAIDDTTDLDALDGTSGAIQFGTATENGDFIIANNGAPAIVTLPVTVFADNLSFEAAGDAFASNSTLTINASGTITDAPGDDTTTDVTATTVTVNSSGGIGTSLTDAFNLSIDTLLIDNTTGDVFLTEVDGIELDTIDVGANDFNLSLFAGSITEVTNTITGVNVTLSALALNASIGTSGTPINVLITGTLTAIADDGDGGIFIDSTGDLDVGLLDPDTGDIEVTTEGALTTSQVLNTGGGILTFIADNGITINENITTANVMNFDADNDGDGSGTFSIVTADVDSSGNDINITAADFSIASSLNSGAGITFIDPSFDGAEIGLGGAAANLATLCNGSACDMTITGAELQSIFSASLSVGGNGFASRIDVDGITAANSANAGLVILDAAQNSTNLGDVIFANNASSFQSLTVFAGEDVTVGADLSTTAGQLYFHPDFFDAGTGEFQVATGVNVSSGGNTLSVVANDFFLLGTSTLNSGAGDTRISASDSGSIGLDGSVAANAVSNICSACGLTISGDELQRITAGDLIVGAPDVLFAAHASSVIEVDGITAEHAQNISGNIFLNGQILGLDTESIIDQQVQQALEQGTQSTFLIEFLENALEEFCE